MYAKRSAMGGFEAELEAVNFEYGQHEYGQHEYGQHEYGQHEYGQHEYGQHEYGQHEYGQHEYGQHEYGQHEVGSAVGIFSPEMEAELAYELLAVNSEAEFGQFLSGLAKRAGQSLRQVVSAPSGQAITGALKNLASSALKGGAEAVGKNLGGQAGSWGGAKVGAWAGQQLGNLVGGKATGDAWAKQGSGYGADWGKALGGTVGSKIAGSLAGMAGRALGLPAANEVSHEEYEFAGAQHFVRMAGEIAERTLAAPPQQARAAAQAASVEVAKQFAPGLLAGAAGACSNSGQWVRRGNKIVLYGV